MDSGSDEGKDWATSVAGGRPDSSVLLRKPGDVFDLQFSIRPPRHGKQKVRKAVDPSDDIRAHCFGMRQFNNLSFGPPSRCSGHVEPGGDLGASGKHKGGHGGVSRFHFVDELLHLGHRRVGEAHGFFLVGGPLGSRQISADVEEPTLAEVQYGMHAAQETFVFGRYRAHCQADDGVRFVNRSISRHAWMIFGDSPSAKEPGGTVITRSCVELHARSLGCLVLRAAESTVQKLLEIQTDPLIEINSQC